MTIVMSPSCWHQNFGFNGFSAPTLGLCLNFFSSITANFTFRLFDSDTPCSNQRKANLKNIWWWYVRKRINHLYSVSSWKFQPSGPSVQWETRQVLFPSGMVDSRVGIFLSQLNTIDGFYLSYIPLSQCANHLYANRNLRYSKWWPSFLLCCFWQVFSLYKELILLWFCLLDSIFKQHYYLRRLVWSEILCFSILCLNHQTWREFGCINCLLVTWH